MEKYNANKLSSYTVAELKSIMDQREELRVLT